jgi:excisionase family DNA binding protein
VEEYLTAREAAERLRLTPEGVRRLVRLHRLRATRVGRSLRIPESAIVALLSSGCGLEPDRPEGAGSSDHQVDARNNGRNAADVPQSISGTGPEEE